jgi:hypothetical protein
MEEQPTFPYRKLNLPANAAPVLDDLRSARSSTTGMTALRIPDGLKDVLRKSLYDPVFKSKCLEHHKMFSLMKGNPHSVTLMARLKSENKRLVDIYRLLKADNMHELLAKEGVTDKNMSSLRLSTAVIVDILDDAKEK